MIAASSAVEVVWQGVWGVGDGSLGGGVGGGGGGVLPGSCTSSTPPLYQAWEGSCGLALLPPGTYARPSREGEEEA